MLNQELVKARQEDLLREAAKWHALAQLPPQPRRNPIDLARRALAHWRAVVERIRGTSPTRRHTSARIDPRCDPC